MCVYRRKRCIKASKVNVNEINEGPRGDGESGDAGDPGRVGRRKKIIYIFHLFTVFIFLLKKRRLTGSVTLRARSHRLCLFPTPSIERYAS